MGSFVAGRSHGLGCTAASGIGADQCCSLPDSPGRPCAAKSAPMARFCGAVIRQLLHSLGEWNFTAENLLLMSHFLYRCSATLQVPDGDDDTLKMPEQFGCLRHNLCAPPTVQRCMMFFAAATILCRNFSSILVDLFVVSVMRIYPLSSVLTLYYFKAATFQYIDGTMRCSFSVIGSLALPDHILRALCAVPPMGDGLTANGDSRLHFGCGERVVIINSTLSGFDGGCLEKHM